MAERIGTRFGTGAAGFFVLLGDTLAALSSTVAATSCLCRDEGDEALRPADRSVETTRLTALGLEEADSEMSSAGVGLVARSVAQVREPGRGTDQADPSCGSSGDGVKTDALDATSLASRTLGPRPGVLTLDAEAVVTASPSMVEGGRPFHTLEGLPLLAAEASGHAV